MYLYIVYYIHKLYYLFPILILINVLFYWKTQNHKTILAQIHLNEMYVFLRAERSGCKQVLIKTREIFFQTEGSKNSKL